MRPAFTSCCLLAFSFWCFGCSQSQKNETHIHGEISSSPKAPFSPLIDHIWRVSDAPYGPASGSIFIFLPNGTLLETSCVETYRVATWSVDNRQPDTLRVIEDQKAVFSATFGYATASTLHLHKKLLRSGEVQDITLTAVDSEFVCPDLRK